MGLGPEQHDRTARPAERLRSRRLVAVAPRPERRDRHRRPRRDGIMVPLALTALAAVVMLLAWTTSLPPAWTLEQRLLHLVAAPGCGWARRVGLAPARRGEAGYWLLHDDDQDGVACEAHVPDRNLTVKLLHAFTRDDLSRPSPGDPLEREAGR